jgi:hypothetical protein
MSSVGDKVQLHTSKRLFMGKSVALFFACATLVILAGSFMAPNTVAARKGNCSPAYGVDPCSTGSIDSH